MRAPSRQGRDSPLEPPPGNPKFSHLDGIRALAALGILGYHATGGTYRSVTGWVEMTANLRSLLPFFFFLSAFLLYRPFVAARLGDAPRPKLATFWWRRFLRIVPAYWVALTLAAVLVGLKGVFGPQGWRYYTFLYVYSHHTVAGGLEPAWTLCVDMTFYIALPLFAALMDHVWRRLSLHGAVRIELGVLAGIWLLSTAYWYLFVSGWSFDLQGIMMREWNLGANLNWFVLGMALAVLSATDRHRTSPLTRLLSRRHAVEVCWGAGIAVYVVMARASVTDSETTRHMLSSLVCVLIFAPAALVGWRGGVQRILAHRGLTWLGLVSYGIYLYHGPIQDELRRHGIYLGNHTPLTYLSVVALSGLVAVTLGAASYYLLERPILRAGRRSFRPASLPAVPSSVIAADLTAAEGG